mmetsp:Transcript_28506/g.83908  ORF Transcript_28506/g.83908 Transcript_28506/m.83908 type:complete len:129 (-) Transcript_28506:45-431(-)
MPSTSATMAPPMVEHRVQQGNIRKRTGETFTTATKDGNMSTSKLQRSAVEQGAKDHWIADCRGQQDHTAGRMFCIISCHHDKLLHRLPQKSPSNDNMRSVTTTKRYPETHRKNRQESFEDATISLDQK